MKHKLNLAGFIASIAITSVLLANESMWYGIGIVAIGIFFLRLGIGMEREHYMNIGSETGIESESEE